MSFPSAAEARADLAGRARSRGPIVGAVVALVALVVVTLAGVSLIGGLGASKRTLVRDSTYLEAVGDAALTAKAIANDQRGYLLSGDPEFLAQIRERKVMVGQALARASTAAHEERQRREIASLSAAISRWQVALDGVLVRAQSDRPAAIRQALGPNRRLRKAYEQQIGDIRVTARAQVTSLAAAFDRRQTAATRVMLGLGVALGLATLALCGLGLRAHRRRLYAEVDLLAHSRRLEELVAEDPLTGLYNHGGFYALLDVEIERAEREGGHFSVVLADLDGFKAVNDEHGHGEGDRVLREVATAMAGACPSTGACARIGGDEFALLLPGVDADRAEAVARKVQRSVGEIGARIGVSYGIAEWPRDGARKEAVMFRADMELYAAKPVRHDGRWIPEIGRVAAGEGLPPEDTEALREAQHEGVQRILNTARTQLGMEIAYVGQFTDDEMVVVASSGDGVPELRPGSSLPLEESYCQRMVDGRIESVVPDTHDDAELAGLDVTRAGIGSYVGVPVRLSRGRVWGSLCCVDPSPHAELGQRDVSFLNVLARLLGDQIDRAEVGVVSRRLAVESGGVRALLAALDARDHYTGEHSASVVELSGLVARALDLSEGAVREVQQVASLHDIGKIGIPDSILQKPGRLDAEELAIMQQHPVIGAGIIASVDALAHLATQIRAEHEHWDGSGYPDGLAGEAIPVADRIVLACDAYHAMTSDRPYRAALAEEEAREELRANAGGQFAPEVVDALLAVLERRHRGGVLAAAVAPARAT